MKFLGWCIIVTAWITILTATFARSQHTFQEFELREQLQQQQINLWELLHQMTYVDEQHREKIREEIKEMLEQISLTVSDLLEAYEKNQPHVPLPAP